MKKHYLSTELVIMLLVLLAGVVVSVLPESTYQRLWGLLAVFAVGIVYFLLYTMRKQHWFYVAAQMLAKNSDKIDQYLSAGSIPMAVTLRGGKICWHNPAFFMLAKMRCEGKNLFQVFPQLSKLEKDKIVTIGGVRYYKDSMEERASGKEYVLYRFLDVNNTHESSELAKVVMAAFCHVQVDNYADLLRAMSPSEHARVDTEIERILLQNAQRFHATCQQYEKDSYLLILERRFLDKMVQDKFQLLSQVRQIQTGVQALFPTISMGVGVGTDLRTANANALAALELALGRGGDQAIVKDEAEFHFFGGVQQASEKRTRVKCRMFAGALRNIMEQSSQIIVMGHAVPDLDAMGAALGLVACARQVGKEARIVLDKPNSAIGALVEEMKRLPDYKDVLITPGEAQTLLDDQALLVVVDTQIQTFTVAPTLVSHAKNIVVIDHHVRGTSYIEEPVLLLQEPAASSASEMVTEVLQYFDERMEVRPLEAEALLAGITIDTKGFSYKTGVRTFEAASYLRKLGADTTSIRHLFQDDLRSFTMRAKIVQAAHVTEDGYAISVCPGEVENPQLLAAQAADALIGIRGINASFVLCEQNDGVAISGRSAGNINVQRILEKMGGGGHATIAGAQVKGVTVEQAADQLQEAIEEYKKEN